MNIPPFLRRILPGNLQTRPQAVPPHGGGPAETGRVPADVDVPNLPRRRNVTWFGYNRESDRPSFFNRLYQPDGRIPEVRRDSHHIPLQIPRDADHSLAAQDMRLDYRLAARGEPVAGFFHPPAYENGPPPPYTGVNVPSGHMLLDHNVEQRIRNGGQLYLNATPGLPTFPSLGPGAEANFQIPPPYGLEPVRQDIRATPPGPQVPISSDRAVKSSAAFDGQAYPTDHRREELPATGDAAAQLERVNAREAAEGSMARRSGDPRPATEGRARTEGDMPMRGRGRTEVPESGRAGTGTNQ